jgi:hypothetical protein
MNKVKIYDIKSGVAAKNAEFLLSKDGKYFFWNDRAFKNHEPGDYIYIVNRTGGWALFTRLAVKDITATFNSALKTSTFNHEFNTYSVQDENGDFVVFVRFDILERVPLKDWNWSTQLGQSEIYDLWKDKIPEPHKRVEKVDDLLKIFHEGEAAETLEECRRLLLGSEDEISSAIQVAFASEYVQGILQLEEFEFKLAQDKLNELIAFGPNLDAGFYTDLREKIKKSTSKPTEILYGLDPATDERKVLEIIFSLIAYCDRHASEKTIWNKYPDHRTLARSGVYQRQWVDHLLAFKGADSRIELITATSIRNALLFLAKPEAGSSLLSEQHRQLVSRYLLNQPAYKPDTFVEDLKEFFSTYALNLRNPINLTRAISVILYQESVQNIWYEKVSGLVVSDDTGWFDDYQKALKENAYAILWWDKSPTGGNKVLNLLRETIKGDKGFDLYFSRHGVVHHVARVVDFATDKEYAGKKWNFNHDVAFYEDDFNDYKDDKGRGARIVYLIDKLERTGKIPVSEFEFYGGYQAPTQNNQQPFRQLNVDPSDYAPDAEKKGTITDLEPVAMSPTFMPDFELTLDKSLGITRSILLAMKTKPFLLLAGISGTGKSRLARTLAFQTCIDPRLQDDKRPGNFELIKVKPNWHDSADLIGYVTRIGGGERYIVTPFIQFLVKAWQHKEVPFFLCLDEMNLAPVEQYFAEYLSVVETRKAQADGTVQSDYFISPRDFREYEANFAKECDLIPGNALLGQFRKYGITLPPNLIVLGTVNMDETTHSFSRKVLDRAMTIEMNQINLQEGLSQEGQDAWRYPEAFISPDAVLGRFTLGNQVYNKLGNDGLAIIEFLNKVNGHLETTPFKIAYRVRDEFLIYCYHESQMNGKPGNWLEQSLDELTFMKILSRIEGDESRVRDAIDELSKLLNEDVYPKCASKMKEMKDRLDKSSYTSFWS